MNRGFARHGHLSKKVPNVKIRPPPAQEYNEDGSVAECSSRAAQRDREDAEDMEARRQLLEQFGEQEAGGSVQVGPDDQIDLEDRPLAGLRICLSGLNAEREKFGKYIEYMGGKHEHDLTDAITHLVANKPGTDKYKAAAKMGMRLMAPDWLQVMHDKWCKAEMIPFEELEKQHTLKPLHGLKISMTAFSDHQRTWSLLKKLEELGATHCPNYNPTVGVTHMIAGSSDLEASDVLKHFYAKRNRPSSVSSSSKSSSKSKSRSGEGRSFIVTEAWVDDCREAGICMDEEMYDVFKSTPATLEERQVALRQIAKAKELADQKIAGRIARAHALIKKRKFGATPGASSSSKRKRTSASGEKLDESGSVSGSRKHVLGSIEEAAEAAGQAKAKRQTAKWETARTTPGEEEKQESLPKRVVVPKVNPFSKNASAMGESLGGAAVGAGRLPLSNSQERALNVAGSGGNSASASAPKSTTGPGVMDNIRIRFDLESPYLERMKAEVVSLGATVMEDKSHADYTIVAFSRPGLEPSRYTQHVTSLWLEQCRAEQKPVAPELHLGSQPTTVVLPLPAAADVQIHCAGFAVDGITRHALSTIIKAIGATESPIFSKNETHLLIASDTPSDHKKVIKARQFGTEIVRMDFLERCYRQGIVDPLPKPRRRDSQISCSPAPGTAIPERGAYRAIGASVSRSTSGGSTSSLLHPDTAKRSDSGTRALAQQMQAALESRSGSGSRRRPRPSVTRPLAGALDRTHRSSSILDVDDDEMLFSATDMDEDDVAEPVPLQTQVLVSYDNPKARREQRKLQAMVSGQKIDESLMTQVESKPKSQDRSTVTETETEESLQGDKPRPVAGAAGAGGAARLTTKPVPKPIRARNQPGARR